MPSPSGTPPPVCNPLGGGTTGGTAANGLVAALSYFPNGQPPQAGVNYYLANATPVNAKLYFDQLNVPTRNFIYGFGTQDGGTLKTATGSTLVEYFALSFNSILKLAPNDRAGLYQFAVLADDGAILQINDKGQGMRTLVNNDGQHSSTLVCANESIAFDSTTRIPLSLGYYQGPKVRIALMLLWRKVSATSSLSDPMCGAGGSNDTTFFDGNQIPSTPSQAYLDMLARGWSVVAPENYLLPSTETNPCTTSSTGSK
jgi:hypothetical protein